MDTMTIGPVLAERPAYSDWLAEVRAKFEVTEEFSLAAEIYSFEQAYDDGMSPAEAYEDFDRWVAA